MQCRNLVADSAVTADPNYTGTPSIVAKTMQATLLFMAEQGYLPTAADIRPASVTAKL